MTNRVQVCDNDDFDWDELDEREVKWLRIAAWRFAQDVLAENAVVPEGEDPAQFAEAAEGNRTLSTLAQVMGITDEEMGEWTR